MPSPIAKKRKNVRSRKLSGQQRPQEFGVPVMIVSANASTTVLTVTFDQPVVLKGVPKFSVDVASTNPVSAVLTSPTTVAVTFNASIAAATTMTIPSQDGAIRNRAGGYVPAGTFPV